MDFDGLANDNTYHCSIHEDFEEDDEDTNEGPFAKAKSHVLNMCYDQSKYFKDAKNACELIDKKFTYKDECVIKYLSKIKI